MSQQKTHIENVIVEREIAGGDEIERGLLAPVSPPQFRAERKQIFSGTVASPIGLQCKLQFAPCTDTRKAEIVCFDHCHSVKFSLKNASLRRRGDRTRYGSPFSLWKLIGEPRI